MHIRNHTSTLVLVPLPDSGRSIERSCGELTTVRRPGYRTDGSLVTSLKNIDALPLRWVAGIGRLPDSNSLVTTTCGEDGLCGMPTGAPDAVFVACENAMGDSGTRFLSQMIKTLSESDG